MQSTHAAARDAAPFDLFLHKLFNRSAELGPEAIISRINYPRVLGTLKEIKNTVFDNRTSYEALRDIFGPNQYKWKETAESLSQWIFVNEDTSARQATASDQTVKTRRKLVAFLQQIVDTKCLTALPIADSTKVDQPNSPPLELFRTAVYLILTVLKDLQDKPVGYFANKLGGSKGRQPPWQTSDGDDTPIIGSKREHAFPETEQDVKRQR